LVGIVGFTRFGRIPHLNSPIVDIVKNITVTHQKARFYFNIFMEATCISLREYDFCFDFEDGTTGAIVYGNVFGMLEETQLNILSKFIKAEFDRPF